MNRLSQFTLRQKLSVALIVFLVFAAGYQTANSGFGLKRTSSVSKGLPASLNYEDVERIYDELRQKYDGQLDVTKLQDGLKKGLVAASGDPYTEYMPISEAKEFNEQLSGSFEGIGAELGKDKDAVIIVSPIAGTPAEKAGLRPKDIIAKINDKDAIGLSVEEARNRIRGPKGTQVVLTVIRDGVEQKVTITRDTITIASVEAKILDGSVGYLKISRFGDDTSALALAKAKEFKAKNVRSVILDLRGNPGGYLDAAVNVSSIWLPEGKIVLQEKRDGKVIKTYNARKVGTLIGLKTVVLIDEGSASASEITAGALKDNGAATLVGVERFGKGSVQEPAELSDGSLLKITIARWFTPKGKNIDKEGIQPDVKVDRSLEDFKAGRDPQLDAAIQKLKQ